MTRRLAWLPLTLSLGCGPGDPPAVREAPTYYADAKAVVDDRCATCHRPGDIGPFSLTTYEELVAFAEPVRVSIENGTMPPWQPSDDCNTYEGDIDLTEDERVLLLDWLAAGLPEGDPADAPSDGGADASPTFEADLSLQLPEAYTPVREHDDYRCQLVPWPEEETTYVTGIRVVPDQRAIVHHAIVFLVGPDQVEQYEAYDAAEEGPGYTCYGGPRASGEGPSVDLQALLDALDELGLTLADLQAGNLTNGELIALMEALGGGLGSFATLGSWVPGTASLPYPEGTGLRVEPGSLLVVQMHYNTLSADPVADRSALEIATADAVERQATNVPILDLGWVTNGLFGPPMTIPAGEAEVLHDTTVAADSLFFAAARTTLGLPADAPLVIHSANHHMHELGTSQRTQIDHADGTSTCLLDIPDWDFAWQGAYFLEQPVTLRLGDALWMGCTWDNSAANQPVVDGEVRAPTDVSWGEGTTDEMCLGSYYVTAE